MPKRRFAVPSRLLPAKRNGNHQNLANGSAASEFGSRSEPPLAAPRVAVVGLGYVGLPTALGLFESGAMVLGIDASSARLRSIGDGDVDLLPQDRERLSLALDQPGAFILTSDAGMLREADVVMICVPTPVDSHLNPDLALLRLACDAVVKHARAGQVIILTSTSYPGCTRDMLAVPLQARGLMIGQTVYIASSPERIDPANAAFPQRTVPRVVGGVTPECTRRAASVVRLLTPIVHTVSSPEAAEMTKLVENSFRAVNIAFANEMAEVARSLDLSISEVIDAAATKPYGFMPFYPGTGVGGHCIPCDPHYLLWRLRAIRSEAPILAKAMTAIAQRPHQVVSQIAEALSESGRGIRGARVLVVGVTYKPDVRDTRGSPAIEILSRIADLGGHVDYHDPFVSSVSLDEQRVLLAVSEPDAASYDLVLIHTLHSHVRYGWLSDARLVLDPSDRNHQQKLRDPESARVQVALAIADAVDLTSPATDRGAPVQRVAEGSAAFTVRS